MGNRGWTSTCSVPLRRAAEANLRSGSTPLNSPAASVPPAPQLLEFPDREGLVGTNPAPFLSTVQRISLPAFWLNA